MKKILFLIAIMLGSLSFAHPVAYTIKLDVSYDEISKDVKVVCNSDMKNKCGLYNIKLLDKNENTISISKFPFLKEQTKVKSDTKPKKIVFFLRKIPEHNYIAYFK